MTTSSSCSAVSRLLAVLPLALGLLGCPPPPPAVVDAGPDSGVAVVMDAGCAGRVGCECEAGQCATGECLGGTCVDCRRGEAACSCRANGTCNAGLRCAASRCETCPAGELGCACGAGDACDTGLLCANGVCAPDTCVAGAEGCPCRTAGTACDATLYCDGASLCRACSNDVVGCPCSAGVCAGDTVCDGANQVCRAPRACAQLACLPNQLCTEASNGADAQCVPMTCLPQFKWDGAACVACVSVDCLAEPSCGDLDGGLGSTCAAQHRECLPASTTCGSCLPGFAQNAAGACAPLPSCGGATCTATQYCDRSGSTPTCAEVPCPAGQALSNGGVCTPCQPNPTCTGPGFSGRTWPIKTAADVCLCETLDDFFIIAGGLVAATACDADRDGWVRQEAGDPLVGADPALRDNMRCDLKRVTRARLFDEYGISIDVLSCTEGLVRASVALPDGGTPNGGLPLHADGSLMSTTFPDGGPACTGFVPMRLLETPRNDLPGNPSASNRAPVYGGPGGRLLEAAELNSLTKACTSLTGDYNDNQLDDIREYQGEVAPVSQRPTPAEDRVRLESFSYFVELDSAYAEGDVLVIRERSRCEALFPFRYDPDAGTSGADDAYALANDKPYWRTCSRGRDVDYGPQRPGFDFAQYECEAQSLSCPLKPPPHPTLVAPADPRTTLFREYGLCRLGGNLPADGLWRGMNHHSQFKCVNVVTSELVNSFDKRPDDFGQANELLTFNECAARPCSSPGAVDCTSPQGSGAQTRQPVLDCRAQPAPGLSGRVGFAAVNYRPYRFADTLYPGNAYTARFYERGCVNEDDAWWDFLCPYPEFVLNRSLGDAQFGRSSCYKFGSNFLWAGTLPDGGTNVGDRSTLRWGGNTNDSVLGPRPPPDGGL